MEKGHFGEYTGNARCCKTPVTKRNYRSSVADDAAHIHYLEEDMKYDKKHHSPFKQTDEREGIETSMPEVVVTGDVSKVGAYGKELDDIFSNIQSTLDKGGYSSSQAQHQAGLGYGTKAAKEFGRLQEMREKEGVIPTLRYIKRRSRG